MFAKMNSSPKSFHFVCFLLVLQKSESRFQEKLSSGQNEAVHESSHSISHSQNCHDSQVRKCWRKLDDLPTGVGIPTTQEELDNRCRY